VTTRPPPPPSPATATGWRHIGDLGGGYSLFEAGGGLMVLDRRAAAERVWYERLLAQYRDGRVESQRLLIPVPVELDPIGAAALNERRTFLHAHGLEIEPFGRDIFRVEAVPVWLAPEDADAFLRDILGLVRTGRLGGKDVAHARDELARTAATRAARPAGEAMPAAAREELLTSLLRCETPHTSPAGRPTFIEISTAELARRFHKTPGPASDVDL
jgi:DNA mismatch repair protein MutL